MFVRKSTVSQGALSTMKPVDNDCKEAQRIIYQDPKKLFHLFGCSVIGSTTKNTGQLDEGPRDSEISQVSEAL